MLKLQRDCLIDLEDAVVAVKNDKGKVMLHQALILTSPYTHSPMTPSDGQSRPACFALSTDT